jgi:hypothetical protein
MHQPEVTDPDYESREDPEYEALQETVSRGIKVAIQKRLDQERAQGPAIAYDILKALSEKLGSIRINSLMLSGNSSLATATWSARHWRSR